MIHFQEAGIYFGEKIIIDRVNWMITPKSRIGLVGDNGTGKTTLFRAMMGEALLDRGRLEIPKASRIGYLPQEMVELESVVLMDYLKIKSGIKEIEQNIHDLETVISRLPVDSSEYKETIRKYESAVSRFHIHSGYSFESAANQALKGLGFRENDAFKNCSDFSGGWKMRIVLSAVLLSKPDIMLLDEPTNHLDTESMEWLESFLAHFEGTLITVAHDRFFLDKMVNEIAELARGKITVYKGNFSFYETEKERRKQVIESEIKHQVTEIKRIQSFVERFRYKATKASQVQSRVKRLGKMEVITREKAEKKIKIHFPASKKSALEVVKAKDLGKFYGSLQVFSDFQFTLLRGEKIALVGINGAGKSTLLRLISRQEGPSSGEVIYGNEVKFAYFSQETYKNLDYTRTIWEEVNTVASHGTDQDKRNCLGAFLFSGDDIHKKVEILSGGEKSRLSLLKILLQDSNFLILDEPTNHLDMKTKEIFQEALMQYKGTVILVSHDRYFLDHLVNRVFEIRDKKLFEYHGNYSYFIEKRASQLAELPVVCKEKPPLPNIKSKEQKRNEAEERNRFYKSKGQMAKKIEDAERQISVLELKKSEYESILCGTEIYKDAEKLKALTRELKSIPAELEKLYDKWNEYTARFDALQAQYKKC